MERGRARSDQAPLYPRGRHPIRLPPEPDPGESPILARPLRIAIALRDARGLSGTVTVARALAIGAAKAGHQVKLLAHKTPKPDCPGVPSKRVGMLPLSSTLRAWSFDLAARLAARRMRADILHGHGDLTRQDVLTVNNVDAAEAHHTGRAKVGSSGTLFVRKRQFDRSRVRRIVTVSRRAKEDLAKFYAVEPKRVEVIYLGVDADRFSPVGREADRTELRRALNLPKDAVVYLSLISGDPERRNIRGLINAFAAAKLPSRAVLVVVGDAGAEKHPGAAALLAAGRLKTLTKTPEPERAYRAADAFVLAAHYETFGMTALEAMACGTPVLVTARCGVSELLEDGVNGLVVAESRDEAALAAALERLAEPKLAAA
ncbi:MAG: glycosyltransferase family 4 protein, partial [Elusimicrobia bacterium]|nr:glycosyltransferase family 4 protein [Elusimicrobiota bacterium]